MTKTFFLDQHGCAKNQVDGEIIISRLENMGLKRVSESREADIIIVNSCGFIESAKKESLDSLMDARKCHPKAKILLAGCLAERYADVFRTELPEADGIFGNGDLSLIDGTVQSLFEDERPVLTPPQKGVCCGERNTLLSFKGSAFVKITEGCDNRCTFCAIPVIRGELRSRNADDIVKEIKSLSDGGVKEINLIGQDLAAYGCGKTDDVFATGANWHDVIYKGLAAPISSDADFTKKHGYSPLHDLMVKISALKGDFKIRLLYIHPDHFNPDILEVMKKDSRFLPYFDIPFQSGDTQIIHAMNRKGSAESYEALVALIRRELPESCIRTTFLTGFPGETEENALATKEFLAKIRSDWSGCFDYSREEDTPAYSMKGRVSSKKAKARAEELKKIQAQITRESLASRCGKTYDVLIEEVLSPAEGETDCFAIGRAWFDAPEVDGSVVVRFDSDDENAVNAVVPGAVIKVQAQSSSDVDISGDYVDR